jgi:hypothetical protein
LGSLSEDRAVTKRTTAKGQSDAAEIDDLLRVKPWWDLNRYILWVATRNPTDVFYSEGGDAFEKVKARAARDAPNNPEERMRFFGDEAKRSLDSGIIEVHAKFPYEGTFLFEARLRWIGTNELTRLVLHCSASDDTAYLTWRPEFEPSPPPTISWPGDPPPAGTAFPTCAQGRGGRRRVCSRRWAVIEVRG